MLNLVITGRGVNDARVTQFVQSDRCITLILQSDWLSRDAGIVNSVVAQ